MKFKDIDERLLWEAVLLASVRSGKNVQSAIWDADDAIRAIRERTI